MTGGSFSPQKGGDAGPEKKCSFFGILGNFSDSYIILMALIYFSSPNQDPPFPNEAALVPWLLTWEEPGVKPYPGSFF